MVACQPGTAFACPKILEQRILALEALWNLSPFLRRRQLSLVSNSCLSAWNSFCLSEDCGAENGLWILPNMMANALVGHCCHVDWNTCLEGAVEVLQLNQIPKESGYI
ncbi:hypothetical protein ONE63_007883 [Megalurothrips usitatus]|uniref:Uncharacterized protein n=1 Tax=Megalurothrips usitatus TaxID=439358 RepID=A0AAV7XSL0_9NEOP|nr:hypothetical protein ONE63_007883 [Megalurothrips usitatus]